MKRIAIVLAALLVAVSANAQIGIIGGLTSSSTKIKDAANDFTSKTISQYHIGITYKIGLGNLLAIQPSLVYNVKGAKMAELSGVGDIDYKTGFIEIPIQIQAGIGLGSLARVYGFAEPFVGYAVTNKVSTNITIAGIENARNTWDNIASKIEYGIGLGVGVELLKHLQVSARYYWNLGNVYDNFSWQSLINAPKGTCNGISVSAAVLF